MSQLLLFLLITVTVSIVALFYVFYGNPLCLLTGGHKPKKLDSLPNESVCEKCGQLIP